MSAPLLIQRDGAVERWTLNDPATRNALNESMVLALAEACLRVRDDDTLRGVVLCGAGASFCAGGSLSGFVNIIGQPLKPGERDPLIDLNRLYGNALHALASLPQWLICAVDGPAMGGGFGLVCCADLVITTERSSFATPEVTLGLTPGQIVPFVWRRLGDAAARQCLLSGARWTAREARAAGLVNQLVGDDELEAAVTQYVAALHRAAPGAVAATKALLTRLHQTTPDLREEAAIAFSTALRGREAAAGLTAFANKQPAPWSAVGPP